MFAVWIISAAVFLAAANISAQDAGLRIDSPPVLESVRKGIQYLEKSGNNEKRLGGVALMGLAALKAGEDEQHPMIRRAVDEIRKRINNAGIYSVTESDAPIYSTGIAIIFLGDLDPIKYRNEIRAMSRFMHDSQRTDGAWTYLTSGSPDAYATGDMSMTQYGVMSLWVLKQNGFPVSEQAVHRVARWLMIAQNENGQYAYMTTISPDFRTASGDSYKPSTTAAGMASVYACRELYGMNPTHTPGNEELPEVFRRLPKEGEDVPATNKFTLRIPKNEFMKIQKRGDDWLVNQFEPIPNNLSYLYYYLYAMERYWSFREIAENKPIQQSPYWYNVAAKFIIAQQHSDGHWYGGCGREVDTSFAILVLLRSTRKSINRENKPLLGGGNMQGGRGLPKTTDNIRIKDGKVISFSESLNTEQLGDRLAELHDLSDEELDQFAQLSGHELDSLLKKQKSNIRNMLSAKNASTRFATVKLLGKSNDINNAPVLILAIDDEDYQVARTAHESLLRITRNPNGAAFPTENDSNYERKRKELIANWKKWYKEIDPNARLD